MTTKRVWLFSLFKHKIIFLFFTSLVHNRSVAFKGHSFSFTRQVHFVLDEALFRFNNMYHIEVLMKHLVERYQHILTCFPSKQAVKEGVVWDIDWRSQSRSAQNVCHGAIGPPTLPPRGWSPVFCQKEIQFRGGVLAVFGSWCP